MRSNELTEFTVTRLSLSHSTILLHQDVLELTGTLKELVQRSQTVNRRTARLWNDLLMFLRWVWATCYSLIMHKQILWHSYNLEPFRIFLEHSVVHREYKGSHRIQCQCGTWFKKLVSPNLVLFDPIRMFPCYCDTFRQSYRICWLCIEWKYTPVAVRL